MRPERVGEREKRKIIVIQSYWWSTAVLAIGVLGATALLARGAPTAETAELAVPGERRLRNIRQLTFGGENAEAYFSFDGRRLIFQSTRDAYPADQIYMMNADGSGLRRVSTGKGRCTCAYFLQGDRRILY